jgi:hypothetical protein
MKADSDRKLRRVLLEVEEKADHTKHNTVAQSTGYLVVYETSKRNAISAFTRYGLWSIVNL